MKITQFFMYLILAMSASVSLQAADIDPFKQAVSNIVDYDSVSSLASAVMELAVVEAQDPRNRADAIMRIEARLGGQSLDAFKKLINIIDVARKADGPYGLHAAELHADALNIVAERSSDLYVARAQAPAPAQARPAA